MDAPTLIHVAAGGISIIAGAGALIVHKGSKNHRLSGLLFVIAMVVMALPGAVMSYLAGKPFDILSSVTCVYMTITGWLAFRSYQRQAYVLMIVGASTCLGGYLWVELYAAAAGVRATDAPPGAGYIFAAVVALALVGDWRRMHHSYDRRQLLRRHFWRMTLGLFFATGSFFGARPHLFPEWMQAYGILLLLSVAPILAMIYWQVKLRAKASV